MLMNIHVNRTFHKGSLAGLTIPQVIERIAESHAGKVGDTWTNRDETYTDITTAIKPYQHKGV